MPLFEMPDHGQRQPGIGQANDRQRSFGFNPRQKQIPGGFQPRMTPPMGGTIDRPPRLGETGRSLGPAGGGIRPPMGLGPKYPFDTRRLGPPANIGRDRMGIGSLQEQAAVDPSAGIMGAMPEERQMAELTEDQMNLMRPGLNQPDLPGGLSKEELWNKVKENEYEGWGGIFGIGAKPPQEPTTREEFDDYYNRLLQGEGGYWVT